MSVSQEPKWCFLLSALAIFLSFSSFQPMALKSGNLTIRPPNGLWKGFCSRCTQGPVVNSDGLQYEVIQCREPSYLSADCTCSLIWEDCFKFQKIANYNSLSCDVQEKRMKESGLSVCGNMNNISLPSQICSIDRLKPGCSENSAQEEFFVAVIRGNKVINPVNSLKTIQPSSLNEAAMVTPECSNPVGTSQWCSFYPTSSHCRQSMAEAGCIIQPRPESTFVVLDAGSCFYPLNTWGLETITYYPFLKDTPQFCSDCWIHCGLKEIVISLNPKDTSSVEICNSAGCELIKTSSSREVFHPRDFHSQTTDTRITARFWDMYGHSLDKDAVCKTTNACDAMNCIICWPFVKNPHCWGTGTWGVMILILWVILQVISSIVNLLFPVYKGATYCVKSFFNLGWLLIRCCCHIRRRATRSSRVKVNSWMEAMELRDLQMKEEEGVILGSEEEEIKESTVLVPLKIKRGKDAYDNMTWLMIVYLFCILFPLIAADETCFSHNSYTYKSTSCKMSGSGSVCSEEAVFDLVPDSVGSTSCFGSYDSDGRLLAAIRLTVLDIVYVCDINSLYFTYEHTMQTDSHFYCSHSGPCYGTWCETVSKPEHALSLDWSHTKGPSRTFCLRGNGCAAMGCFFCTSSCIVARYYASPVSKERAQIMECTAYTPKATVMMSFSDKAGTITRTFSIGHLETTVFTNNIKIRADLSLGKFRPVLGKNLIKQGDKWALVSASPAGQPLRGTIGQVQCKEASTDIEDCSMAPNLCNCGVSGHSMACECSNLNWDAIFSKQNILPLHTVDGVLIPYRDTVAFRASGQGSLSFKIATNREFESITMPPTACTVRMNSLSGCYQCQSGAIVNYTCSAINAFQSRLLCNHGEILISCGPQAQDSTSRIQANSPIMTLECKAACDTKTELTITGTLHYVGYGIISNDSFVKLGNYSHEGGLSKWSVDIGLGRFLSNIWTGVGAVRFILIAVPLVICCLMLWALGRTIMMTIHARIRNKSVKIM